MDYYKLQADGIKLFLQRGFYPANACKPIFKIAPIITATTAFIAMSAVPFYLNLRCLDIQFDQ